MRYRNDRDRLRKLRRELVEMLPRLIDDQTEKVILFGSAARGEVGATSDLDVLIVRHDERRFTERQNELYQRVQPRIAVDILIYTPDELTVLAAESSFLRTALREGEVLYERSRAVA